LPRPPAIEAEQRPDVDGQHGATEAVVPRQQVAQLVGEAEHPLADGHVGQDPIYSVGCALGHAASSAARAETAPLAGERQQVVQPAAVALEAGEALGKNAAREEFAELVHHEAR
jgi:hypothetical protein